MTTATANLNAAGTGNGTFSRLMTAFMAELRRAIELAGAPYMNGPVPPM